MATQNTKTVPKKKEVGVWRSFFALMTGVKLPWLWLGLTLLFNLFWAQLVLMFPDATATLMGGNIGMQAVLSYTGLIFLQGIVSSVQLLVEGIASYKVDLNFQRYVLKKVMRLPIPYYDKNMADELISRTTDDTTQMRSFLTRTLLAIPQNVYILVGVLAILGSYDWRLVALIGVTVALSFILPLITARISFRWNILLQSRLAALTGYLAEALQNIPLMKVFVQEKREADKGLNVIKELYATQIKYLKISTGLGLLGSVESTISLMVNVLGGVYLIQQGYITVEVWIMFYMYNNSVIEAISAVGPGLWGEIKAVQGSTRRISEIAAEPDESQGGQRQLRQEQGDIVLENVSFGYGEKELLRDLSFTIPHGKTTAIIGRSGEGKSTLFALLERFYTPTGGSITVNGSPIEDYNMKSWRQAIGYVSQNTNLLSGTVRDNIVYGVDREVSQEEIEAAARTANAYGFIMALENGFDTQVGLNGSKLSGGQRQRICIARELLKDPAILLLDEATSSLDMEAEYEVTQALNRLREGRTTLLVSHRLSTAVGADQIVYLSDHLVSGVGTHKTLLRDNGSYRELIQAQQGAAS